MSIPQKTDVAMPLAEAKAPPATPTFRQPTIVRVYNGVARRLARIGIEKRVPTPDKVLRAARCRARLHDFGEPDPTGPLAVLLETLEREARLHRFARDRLTLIFSTILSKRLRIVDFLKRHPEVLETPVHRPMFILGFPRTGTTLLFNLLAQDPDARPLLGWQALHPVPPRRYPNHRRDRRQAKARRTIQWMSHFVNPEHKKMHEVRVDGPQECIPLLTRTLVCRRFASAADIPSYERWMWQLDRSVWDAVYRFYRAQVQLVQWQQA